MELPEFKNPFSNAKLVGANVDADAYHLDDPAFPRGHPGRAMTRSELGLFTRNPQNWLAGYKPKDTDATEWGSLIDCLVTDRGRFDQRYAIPPETCTATKTMSIVKEGKAVAGEQVPWNPQCKECKDWKAEQESDGLTVVDAEMMLEATSAVARLMKDPVCGPFIKCSAFQVMCVAEYKDPETGLVIPVKTLTDLVCDKAHPLFGKCLGDFKTAREADPDGWRWVVHKRNYDWQAAMNMDVYTLATGEDRTDFRHIIQENVAPYQPARRHISAEFMRRGREKCVMALRLYCRCLRSGVFPSWDDEGQKVIDGFTITEPPERLMLYGE